MLADAHNHLQDPRLDPIREAWLRDFPAHGIAGMTVNGTHPGDWPAVAALADRCPQIVPSFGLHPWRVRDCPHGWERRLARMLEYYPHAAVGEIGLDHWIRDPDKPAQRAVFEAQWRIAADMGRAVTVHGLRCWGTLLETVAALPRNPRGFLLHSYGGPAEQIPRWLDLGAYFSVSPAFLAPRKAEKLAALKAVPADRLMVETDAPDMAPPLELNPNPLDPEGKWNHPMNLFLTLLALDKTHDQSKSTLTKISHGNWSKMFL